MCPVPTSTAVKESSGDPTDDDDDLAPQEWSESASDEGAYHLAWTHPDPELDGVVEPSGRRRRRSMRS